MEKIFSVLIMIVFCTNSFAQIKREVKPVDKSVFTEDSIKQNKQYKKKQLFNDLGLTKEQQGKLKEIRQVNKAKRQAINDNDSLSNEEKRTQLKAVNRSADASIKAILTDEQWQKYQEQRKNKMNKPRENSMKLNEDEVQ